MKNHKVILGIDVSKLKLDILTIDDNNNVIYPNQIIKNQLKEIKKFLRKVRKEQGEDLIVAFENTGIYSFPLTVVLGELEIDFIQLSSLEISRSKGISRGKSDKIDAKQIAQYVISHRFKIKLTTLSQQNIIEMKLLYSQREKIIKANLQFKMNFENNDYLPKSIQKELIKTTTSIIKNLKKNLKKIEDKIDQIIKSDEELNKNFELITSIPGVGKQTAIYLLIVTQGFKSFNNARQLACYAGVAPFPYQSGSSINGRTKVNHFADKKLKTLLNMCALTAKKYDYEIKEYFEKKVGEGKNKMLVLNNIRNKILTRVYAVVNRQQPYVNTRKFAA